MINIPKKEKRKSVFQIGDTVYILGKRVISSDAPLLLIAAKISHMKHRQFVAYEIGENGELSGGEWHFSDKYYGLSVFKDRNEAVAARLRALKNYNNEGVNHAV